MFLKNIRNVDLCTTLHFFKNIPYSRKRSTDFKVNKSITHAVLDVITTVYDQINDDEYASVNLVDFKKAFDTVKHSILTKKLEHYDFMALHLIF